MFSMKFSMEKQIKKFWIAVFFLPAINATVFILFYVSRKKFYADFTVVLDPNSFEDSKILNCVWSR